MVHVLHSEHMMWKLTDHLRRVRGPLSIYGVVSMSETLLASLDDLLESELPLFRETEHVDFLRFVMWSFCVTALETSELLL